MKILICTGIYPPDFGGPATYSKLLFDELPKKGIDVDVLSFGEVRHLPKIIRHFTYFIKTLKRGKGVDLIYAQDPVSVGFPACLASRILGKKFILKVVGDYAWEQQQQRAGVKFVTPEDFQNKKFDFVTEIRRKIERHVAKRASKIIVPSNYLKKIVMMWSSAHGNEIPSEKVQVIFNAFAPKEVLETKEELRKRFGFEGKIIFSVGRLVPWKGFEMLIQIMKDLPEIKLFIAGDGPDRERLEKKIKDLNLTDRVKMLGKLEQDILLKQIKASDIFVLNTGYEGLSHQLLEVMSLDVPIVTTNIGGNPELIEDNKQGLLVEYNNEDQLKNIILSILRGYINIENITENAKEKLKSFSREKMLEEITKGLKD
ncbi:glycosyltransferase family 4 protein [Patescibacteria group bacterium]|nr:glycosyltransferase family 4 protein [Patescibacteria group bacterium]